MPRTCRDRCPPDTEAVQLPVKNPRFIVVRAIDERHINRRIL